MLKETFLLWEIALLLCNKMPHHLAQSGDVVLGLADLFAPTEAEPFNCVRCGKPFGTRQMVENMLGKLGAHSMFAGGTRRLQMCGDCRVVDMMENKAEATIFDYKK